MSALKVGDVCELVKCSTIPDLVGRQCVIENFWPVHDESPIGILVEGYRSEHHTGQIRVAPSQLRRIDPKSDPLTDFAPADDSLWDLCGWSPSRAREKV